jgi:hypothetical protein
MARKPCASSVPQLIINKINCGGCENTTGRFNRVARNAIMPFYYDCRDVTNPTNNLEQCRKVFYVKNPSFYSGSEINHPNTLVTQSMLYSHLAKTKSKNKTSILIESPQSCANIINWYNIPSYIFDDITYNLNCDRSSSVQAPIIKNI